VEPLIATGSANAGGARAVRGVAYQALNRV
jgi:hypothetical protein